MVFWKRKKDPEEKPEPLEDIWTLAELEEDGLKVIFRFRESPPLGISIEDFPRLVNLYWRNEAPENWGMPTPDQHDHMSELENLLDKIEGPDLGYLVLSITGNHRKEWIWYVRDDDRFVERLNVALSGRPKYPIEIEAADDPGWSNYLSLVDALVPNDERN